LVKVLYIENIEKGKKMAKYDKDQKARLQELQNAPKKANEILERIIAERLGK